MGAAADEGTVKPVDQQPSAAAYRRIGPENNPF
jgi:hypothetical protein